MTNNEYKYKQVILIRTDVKMSCGKKCGHVAHASVASLDISDEFKVMEWVSNGYPKIILKVGSEDEIRHYQNLLMENSIGSVAIHDRGYTQIEPNTWTTLGIEVIESDIIDKFTGDLKLL